MKKQLLKSLIAFLIFNAAILISAKAQIIYTDVNPDVTVDTNGGVYHLDLNNDSVTDFKIQVKHWGFVLPGGHGHNGGRITAYPRNRNAIKDTNSYHIPFSANQVINSTLTTDITWDTTNQGNSILLKWANGFILSGYWNNTQDNYLGLRLKVAGQIYYGWARLRLSYGLTTSCIIKDYAYNSIPNQPILAGETTCTVPTVTLTPNGALSICQGDNVTLSANGTGYQYQWKKNGVNISGAKSQTYVANTAGTYKVKVTNSCGSQISNSAIVIVGLPCKNSDASLSMTSDVLEHLSVYPNPATNSVTIKIPSNEAGEIQIVNLFGRAVETHNYASLRDGELQIDVSKFPAGMYVVRWRSGENYQAEKFSVIK